MKSKFFQFSVLFFIPLFLCVSGLSAFSSSKGETYQKHGVQWQKVKLDANTGGLTAAMPGDSFSGVSGEWYFTASEFDGGACEVRFLSEKVAPFDSIKDCLKVWKEAIGSAGSVSSVKVVDQPLVMYAVAIKLHQKSGELPHKILVYHTKTNLYQIHYLGKNHRAIEEEYFKSVKITK